MHVRGRLFAFEFRVKLMTRYCCCFLKYLCLYLAFELNFVVLAKFAGLLEANLAAVVGLIAGCLTVYLAAVGGFA